MCFWCWRMNVGASFTSRSQHIPRRTGRLINFWKPSPWETAPRYLLRDRDRIFGHEFVNQLNAMGVQQVLSAPRSPWQSGHIERLIGSVRRECLDHLIIFNERTLKCHLSAYMAYYHRTRTHLALQKDCPEPRAVQPVELGSIVSIPEVGGLHHRYERRVA